METIDHTYLNALTVGRTTGALLRQRHDVLGMTCSHCEQAIAAEVSQLPGVVTVVVDAAAGTVAIEATRELDRAEIAAAVDDAGYELAR